jgi:hypothetical protein
MFADTRQSLTGGPRGDCISAMEHSMTRRSRHARGTRGLACLCLLLFALVLAGCNSVPAECTQAHSKAVAALQSKDKAAFKALVVPSQRSGPLGLKDSLGIKSSKKVSTFTLEDVLDIQFFHEAKKVKVNEDLSSMDDSSTARLGATFDFGGSTSAVRSLVLKKEGSAWFIDLKATLEWWEKMNGADAFTAIGLK